MTATTMIPNNYNRPLQDCGKRCLTAMRRNIRRTILYILALIICIAAVAFAYFHFHPAMFSHPDFESAALSGTPQVEKEYGYSLLSVQEGYSISICGAPAVNENEVFFNITNPSDNSVWIRMEVLNANGEVIGSSGVLKQGQYLPSIELKEELEAGTSDISVRIIGYEPNTWQSRGNVNLQMVLGVNE